MFAVKSPPKRIAIVVGGGPAPGINSVIAAATIEARKNGIEVVGSMDGFKPLVAGDGSALRLLDIEDVSRIHLKGGSVLRTSRENPTTGEERLDTVVRTLLAAGVDGLVTIGGDDTAFAARCVSERAGEAIRSVHVPKTIDNDLPLPDGTPTFGYETARHAGVGIVQTLMEDARTTSRWYFVVAMGRKAGHLALGIGKAAGATLTVIGEEFGKPRISLREVTSVLEGAVLRRLADGRSDGVAVLAEGLAERIDPEDLPGSEDAERDEFGHLRIAEVDLGGLLRDAVRAALAARGIKLTIVAKNIGYELRCHPPIPIDVDYTRDLGWGAVRVLMSGHDHVMVARSDGHLRTLDLEDLRDPDTGKTKVRLVDVEGESYRVAREYMLRLTPDILADDAHAARIAVAANVSVQELRAQFE
jgi:6-phosphofructokinase 1